MLVTIAHIFHIAILLQHYHFIYVQFRNSAVYWKFRRGCPLETEAALNRLLYHPNTATFFAYRFCQRFGVSNPAPRYLLAVATAFQTAQYTFSGETFGSENMVTWRRPYHRYGLLDREARPMALDADPAQGSLREPIVKVLSFICVPLTSNRVFHWCN